ncbi:MAG: RloB family protein [archaeon]|nr:RloB family protein [archaeon]
MDLKKLSYSKVSSEQPLREVFQKHLPSGTRSKKGLDVPALPAAYTKTDGILPVSLVFVISGGEKKEKNFLIELIRQKSFHSLRVAFLSKKGQGLQPYQMQDIWQDIQKTGEFVINGQTYRLDETDKVFLLTDVDEYYDQLLKIIATGGTGQWIISNPCFEMWLYYCYLNDPENDLACLIPLTVDKRSQKLKGLGKTLVPGGLNPVLAFERMTEGIANSKLHYAMDENGVPVLFATQMHEMAECLVNTLNANADEYSEYVKAKAEFRERMKKK